MEITEKKQTPPILSSSGGAESAFGEPKDGPWRKSSKTLQLGGRKLAVCDKLNGNQGAKMEILVQSGPRSFWGQPWGILCLTEYSLWLFLLYSP
jgi:hypothetical protein